MLSRAVEEVAHGRGDVRAGSNTAGISCSYSKPDPRIAWTPSSAFPPGKKWYSEANCACASVTICLTPVPDSPAGETAGAGLDDPVPGAVHAAASSP